MGHQTTVFEMLPGLGGMLRYGIPNYRLPKRALTRDTDAILATGVKVRHGVKIGEDLTLDALRRDFDVTLITIGASTDKKLGLEHEDAPGAVSAVRFLRDVGKGLTTDLAGRRVAVVGGGNVAMDVARSAVRLKADKVSVVYRRRRVDMTAIDQEIEAAMSEGCEVYDLYTPQRIEVDENNRVRALHIQPQIISKIRGDNRPGVAKAGREALRIPCDLVIVAIGQGIESKEFEKNGIPVKEGSIASLSCAGIEGVSGIYAGGDCVSGPATVIRAIAAGKVAAANIDEYLGFNHIIETDVEIPQPSLADRSEERR